jgi:peptide chain release factor 1
MPSDTPKPDSGKEMIEVHVAQLQARKGELERLLASPEVLADPGGLAHLRAQRLSQEYRLLTDVVRLYDQLRQAEKAIADTREVLEHARELELAEMARTELSALERQYRELEAGLLRELAPKDPDSDKNCIIEIRAAAGGEESGLFAGDLFRMYTHYVERMGWKLEVLSSHPSELGGFREMIAGVEGDGPYRFLRFESGVHRVQRVPRTEASGRIHTSTVTVAVMPEVEATDVKVDSRELRIEVFRAGGHGGQLVNKIESAVRITHIPTGIQASCQDDRSQTRNKAKAMKILLARIKEARDAAETARITERRRTQVGTGERSEKIRTYNFPQNRVTDHRIGLTLHNLLGILNGDLAPFHQALMDKELKNWLTANGEAGERSDG